MTEFGKKMENFFENKELMAVLRKISYVIMAILVVIDVVLHVKHIAHEYMPWDKVWGFSSVLGFVSCIIIIVGSKWLGKVWLQKDEDYYNKD